MTRENTIKCSSTINSKKEQNKKKQMEVKRNKKTNADSDHDDNIDDMDDSEQELDILEYRKLLSNLFPSKYAKEKLTAVEKLTAGEKKGLIKSNVYEDEIYGYI